MTAFWQRAWKIAAYLCTLLLHILLLTIAYRRSWLPPRAQGDSKSTPAPSSAQSRVRRTRPHTRMRIAPPPPAAAPLQSNTAPVAPNIAPSQPSTLPPPRPEARAKLHVNRPPILQKPKSAYTAPRGSTSVPQPPAPQIRIPAQHSWYASRRIAQTINPPTTRVAPTRTNQYASQTNFTRTLQHSIHTSVQQSLQQRQQKNRSVPHNATPTAQFQDAIVTAYETGIGRSIVSAINRPDLYFAREEIPPTDTFILKVTIARNGTIHSATMTSTLGEEEAELMTRYPRYIQFLLDTVRNIARVRPLPDCLPGATHTLSFRIINTEVLNTPHSEWARLHYTLLAHQPHDRY